MLTDIYEYFNFLIELNDVAPDKAREATIKYYKEHRIKDSKQKIEEFDRWYKTKYTGVKK